MLKPFQKYYRLGNTYEDREVVNCGTWWSEHRNSFLITPYWLIDNKKQTMHTYMYVYVSLCVCQIVFIALEAAFSF